MQTNRLEAFSDGVFAIAITLLVLEIPVPEAGEGGLWDALVDLWPSFVSYLVSFVVIGIIWVNHHGVIDHLARANRGVLFLNLLFLLWVAFIPFPTALLAEHLDAGVDEDVAAAVYCGTMALMGLSFGGMWAYITRRRELLGVELTDNQIRRLTVSFVIGSPLYILAIGVSFLSAGAALAIVALLAVYYAFAGRGGGMQSPGVR